MFPIYIVQSEFDLPYIFDARFRLNGEFSGVLKTKTPKTPKTLKTPKDP